MDNKNLEQLLKIKAMLAAKPQKFDGGGQVQPQPSPSSGPYLDPDKAKQFQKGFNSGDITLSQALANVKKSLGFADGGAVPSLSNLSDDELKALLNKTSDSVDDTKNTDALVDAPASTDDGFDSLRAKLNALSDQATTAGQAASDETTGKDPVSPPVDLDRILANSSNPTDPNSSQLPGKDNFSDVASLEKNTDSLADLTGDDQDRFPATTAVAGQQSSSPIAKILQQAQAQQSSPQPTQDPNDPFNPAALQQAQEAQRYLTMAGGMGAAGDTIAKAFSRGAYQGSPDFWQNYQKNVAPQAVNNLLQRQQVAQAGTEHQLKNFQLEDEKEMNSSGSGTSRLAQSVLKSSLAQANMPIPDGIDKISASSIKINFPSIAHIVDTQLRTKVLREEAATRNAMLSNNIDRKQGQKDEVTAVNLQKQLDSSGPRAGNFGKAGGMSMAADRINAILKQFPDGNIPKAQTEELATAAAALVGGGSTQSQQQIHSVVPQSLAGDASSWFGYLTNHPEVLHQPTFIKNLSDSANREKQVAEQQMNDIKIQRLSAYNDFANRHPETFNRIIQAAGLDPSAYDMKSGEYKRPQAKSQFSGQQGASRNPQSSGGSYSPAQEAGITAVMNGNNVSRDTAIAALKKAGKL